MDLNTFELKLQIRIKESIYWIMKGALEMSKIKQQKDRVNSLLKLIAENPSLRIVPMVDSDLHGYDFSYYEGYWGVAEIDRVYYDNEKMYFQSDDEEYLIERQADLIFDEKYSKYKRLSETESEGLYEDAKSRVDNFDWEKVITIKIMTP